MEQAKRSSLAKACLRCIKARKKCDKMIPKCQRCEKWNVPCGYTNGNLVSQKGEQGARIASNQKSQNLIRINNNHDVTAMKASSNKTSNTINVLPDALPYIVNMEVETVSYMIDQLGIMPKEFAQTGRTAFVHPQLYPEGLPMYLRQISALYHLQPHYLLTDQGVVAKAIGDVARLLHDASPSIYGFMAILEFVQALVLLQIVMLSCFWKSRLLHDSARSHFLLMKRWTEKLYRAVPSSLPSTMTKYQAWIIAESVRRTIHTSHLIQEVFCMCTHGYWQLTLFVKALPVNMSSTLWDYDLEQYSESKNLIKGKIQVADTLLRTDLISYRELTDKWNNGDINLTTFEELLLIACKGMRVVMNNR